MTRPLFPGMNYLGILWLTGRTNPRLPQTRPYGKPNPDLKPTVEIKDKQSTSDFKKWQCFKCGDRWAPGHQCKRMTLHQIEAEYLEEENTDEEEIVGEASLEEGENDGEVN